MFRGSAAWMCTSFFSSRRRQTRLQGDWSSDVCSSDLLVASMGGRMEAALLASGAELERMTVHSKNPLTILGNALRLAALIRRRKVSLVHVRSRAPADRKSVV